MRSWGSYVEWLCIWLEMGRGNTLAWQTAKTNLVVVIVPVVYNGN